MVLSALAIMICAYLLGSINFAIIISGRKYHEDIRSHGSKNAGMTNMMRTYGRSAAAFTLIGDALKAVVSCFLGYAVWGLLGAFIGGFFCTFGHVFPVFYRFKGGKGVVTAFATILMCDPFVFPLLLVLFVLIVLCTKFIFLGSVMCMLIYPVLHYKFYGPGMPVIFTMMIAFLIVFKHWANIKRLLQGKESKFSFKKSKTPEDVRAEASETETKR
jgi:glycerol-3-phosphate acyltransferase PlsY